MDESEDEKQWLHPYKVNIVNGNAETSAHFSVKLDGGKPERVHVTLEREEPGKEPQFFQTTLEKLERAAEEVRAFYARTESRPETRHIAELQDPVVRMAWTKEEKPDVSVLLMTHENGEVQHLVASREELEKTVEEGRRLEAKQGIERGYYHIVDMRTFEIHGEHACSARVIASYSKEDELSAHLRVHHTKSLGYLAEPKSRAHEEGERIFLRPEESVNTSWGWSQVASKSAADVQFIRERTSEDYVVVEWGHARPPMLGEEARWEGIGVEYNGRLKDFRGGPARGGDLSDQDTPMYALIRKDELRFGVGVVVAVSFDRKEMTEKLTQLDQQKQDMKKLVEEARSQTPVIDLSKVESRQEELRQEYKRKL